MTKRLNLSGFVVWRDSPTRTPFKSFVLAPGQYLSFVVDADGRTYSGTLTAAGKNKFSGNFSYIGKEPAGGGSTDCTWKQINGTHIFDGSWRQDGSHWTWHAELDSDDG